MRTEPFGFPGEPATFAWRTFGDIAKAMSILQEGTTDNVSVLLGNEHKARNFYGRV